VTPLQAKALAALMLGVKPHDVLPAKADIVDGCFPGGMAGRTPNGVAESMRLWDLMLMNVRAQSVGRLLNGLVRQGFAARVFVPSEASPLYVPTKEGRAEHERRTPGWCGHAKCRAYVRCIYNAKRGAEPWPEKRA
jgi:hypothetical protein